MNDWQIFTGQGKGNDISKLPKPPSWRAFGKENQLKTRGETFQVSPEAVKMVNAALYLRRPLLITGKPGTGKSSLAYKVAVELDLGQVLYWPITTRTTLKDGLYNYDALGRLQEVKLQEEIDKRALTEAEQIAKLKQIEKYITLGPLGTAFLPSKKPRVLLIDEIDKSDIDLPNDLLSLFEEGRFEIPELERLKEKVKTVTVRTSYTDEQRETDIHEGLVACTEFPFVVLTSNGERDFPPAFLRRCLRLSMKEPDKSELRKIIEAHLGSETANMTDIDKLIENFIQERNVKTLATDQLLNAIFMVREGRIPTEDDLIVKQLLMDLGGEE